MTTLAVTSSSPTVTRSRKWLWALVIFGVVAAVPGIYFGRSMIWAGGGGSYEDLKFYTVTPGEMQVKVHKDGELQSVNNTEIMSQVEGISTIVQIVKEGTFVNAGDVLVELDSSSIRQRIEDTTLELQRAESDVAAARNAVEIQESQNAANLEAAEVEVQLGKLAIAQYVDGLYPQDLATAEVTLKMAEIDLGQKEDDFKQVKELYGKGFVNLAEVKTAELGVEKQRNAVDTARVALDVLKKYTHPMTLAEKTSYVKQAEQKLARTKRENQNNLAKATTALETQEAAKKIMERRLARYKEQLAFCTIKAPQSGLVVYNSSSRDSQPIQEGTQVRERQVLLRLPDTSAMKAAVRINESQVIRLALGQRAIVRVTGIREPIGASITRISPVSDSSSRWSSPDTREYPVELTLDWTPPNLKPGIGVRVEVLVEHISNALTVPLSALYAAGQETFVFTPSGNGQLAPRQATVGMANETHVQILSGIQAGEQVVLLEAGQGRDLLQKAGVTPRQDEEPTRVGPEPEKEDKPGRQNDERASEDRRSDDRRSEDRVGEEGGERRPSPRGPRQDDGTDADSGQKQSTAKQSAADATKPAGGNTETGKKAGESKAVTSVKVDE